MHTCEDPTSEAAVDTAAANQTDQLHNPDNHAHLEAYWEKCSKANEEPTDWVRREIQARVGQIVV